MASGTPRTPPPHRRWLLTLPAAVIAAFVAVACLLFAWFAGGGFAALATAVAAIAGSVWGSLVVLSLPDRLRR